MRSTHKISRAVWIIFVNLHGIGKTGHNLTLDAAKERTLNSRYRGFVLHCQTEHQVKNHSIRQYSQKISFPLKTLKLWPSFIHYKKRGWFLVMIEISWILSESPMTCIFHCLFNSYNMDSCCIQRCSKNKFSLSKYLTLFLLCFW